MLETLPVRGIGEHAYCSRLFHYMVVEKIFIPSDDTIIGLRVHNKVDSPSQLSEEEPKAIRSLELSSSTLGIHGVLDLLEINENNVSPVEYRKGRPFIADDGEVIPWPTDLVQVGLQCHLLIEHGYSVNKAFLYYASEKRKVELKVDDTLLENALTELENARITLETGRPLPLVNSPKCPRCSLNEICLPDEINLVNNKLDEEGDKSSIRVLRKDGIQLIVQEQGSRISLKGDRVIVKTPNKEDTREIPFVNIENVCIYGNIQITTQAINKFSQKGIAIGYFTRGGKFSAIIEPNGFLSAHVRRSQHKALGCKNQSLELAKSLIEAKIANQRTLLMRNSKAEIKKSLKQLKHLQNKVQTVANLESLRGIEGKAAAIYFENFPSIFKKPFSALFSSNGRARRPPPDPINSILSFGYSMLTNECVSALRMARLDPALGALHCDRIARPALALDLMEPLRPLIVDSIAISAFNRGELKEGHFNITSRGTILTSYGRKAFFKAWGRRMDTMVKHPLVDHRISYRQMIHLHAKLIASWMSGETEKLVMMKTR